MSITSLTPDKLVTSYCDAGPDSPTDPNDIQIAEYERVPLKL